MAARRQAEEALAALRQSREDLDRAQAVGQIGSWRLDVSRNVLTWSDENHRIFGVPKGTPLTYETFLGIVHPDDRQYVDTQWKAGLRGEPYDIEHRLVVDGQVKWVREKAYLEFDDAGKPLGGFGITEDITERKRAEEEIRALSLFPEQNPNPVLRIARDGAILYANSASAPLLRVWEARCGELAPSDWIQRAASALASGKVEETEVACLGRVYSCVLAPIGDQGYVNLYARDITPLRQSEQALQRLNAELEERVAERTAEVQASEARYRSFVTASTQVIWTTDAQGLVAGDMPSWRAFTGQSLEEIQGWSWLDALHPDDRQRTAEIWSQAVAARSLYAVEYRVRRHDGQYRWLSVRGVPVLAGDNGPRMGRGLYRRHGAEAGRGRSAARAGRAGACGPSGPAGRAGSLAGPRTESAAGRHPQQCPGRTPLPGHHSAGPGPVPGDPRRHHPRRQAGGKRHPTPASVAPEGEAGARNDLA